MCYIIYGALILTFGVYSDALLGQYVLATAAAQDQWTVVAMGWELVGVIWPLLVFVAILSSALTFSAIRLTRLRNKGPSDPASRHPAPDPRGRPQAEQRAD